MVLNPNNENAVNPLFTIVLTDSYPIGRQFESVPCYNDNLHTIIYELTPISRWIYPYFNKAIFLVWAKSPIIRLLIRTLGKIQCNRGLTITFLSFNHLGSRKSLSLDILLHPVIGRVLPIVKCAHSITIIA